jgi:hypothetical protein
MNAVSRWLLPPLVALLAAFLGEQTVSAVAQTKPADRLEALESIAPPWQGAGTTTRSSAAWSSRYRRPTSSLIFTEARPP